MQDLRNKAKFILEELQPQVASDETIQATREELVANAEVGGGSWFFWFLSRRIIVPA
jgi:hypothetical protein